MPTVVLTPRAYSRLTAAALAALAVIVVTGAAVRLTGSGLGCPDWPTCAEGRVVAPLEYHALIEFANRLVTAAVSLAVIVAVLGSFLRVPRRLDLALLSLGLVGGVVAQILLGAAVVYSDLWPPLVMGHFVVSMLLLLDATILHHRAGLPDGVELRPAVDPTHLTLGRLLVVAAAVAISLGTVVTGAGPHAGSHEGEFIERLPFAVAEVARFHGVAAMIFLLLAVVTVRLLIRDGAAPVVVARARIVLIVTVAQAAVGYTQYFSGVPPLLVAVHVAGSVALWVAVLRLVLAMHVPAPSRVAVAA